MVASPSFRPTWAQNDLPIRSSLPAADEGADRRRTTRYEADLLALVDPLVEGRPPTRVTRVADLSGDGVGLLAAKSYPTGSVLWLELIDQTGHSYSRLRARLIHATQQENGGWRLGCQVIMPTSKPS